MGISDGTEDTKTHATTGVSAAVSATDEIATYKPTEATTATLTAPKQPRQLSERIAKATETTEGTATTRSAKIPATPTLCPAPSQATGTTA